MNPRIYTYKITFEEVPHYYYGVHKEKNYNEEYWGSPVTHKHYWDQYTPKKEIIKEFPYTDDGWIEAQNYESDLIKSVFMIDDYCLNEACGGIVSLEACKVGGQKTVEQGIGIHAMTKEELSRACKKGGQITLEKGIGIHGLSPEKLSEAGRKGGRKGGQITTNQKWQCTETGFIANPGNLSHYQKSRKIDTKNRIRIS